jgi:hypothetical protein
MQQGFLFSSAAEHRSTKYIRNDKDEIKAGISTTRYASLCGSSVIRNTLGLPASQGDTCQPRKRE